MKTRLVIVLCLLSFAASAQLAGTQVGQVMIVNYPVGKDNGKEDYMPTIKEVKSGWGKNKNGISAAHFKADRGKNNGGDLLVCMVATAADRKSLPSGSPFSGGRAKEMIANPDKYTEYQLIGADQFGELPVVNILGFHYIKVKPERAKDFEQFVISTLHPAVGHLFPDMQMLYFKATAGENASSYITLWTIKSVEARDQYWPAGKPETELLKTGYRPLNELAKKLEQYLVEGSYLAPGGGVAAIFESKEWTDYVMQ